MKLRAFMNKDLWRTLFAGPLRVKVVVEREDGTELYHVYPLDGQTVEWGQTVHVDFEVGVDFSEI